MATITKHTEETIKQYNIADEEMKKDVYLIHEYIDRIKYTGPEIQYRTLSHNVWFINYMLPLYLEWSPLVKHYKQNKQLYHTIGVEHLLQDFKGFSPTLKDIFDFERIPKIKSPMLLSLLRVYKEEPYKKIIYALVDSQIPYLFIGSKCFVSSYILHGLLTNAPETKDHNTYKFVSDLRKTIDNYSVSVEDIYNYMNEEIPNLNNGLKFIKNKPKNYA